MRVFPGLAPGDTHHAERRQDRAVADQDAAAGIKAIYQDMLDRAWSDAVRSRREAARPGAEGDPAEVPGQQ